MNTLVISRAYRVVKPLQSGMPLEPCVGDVVYSEKVDTAKGVATLMFEGPDGDLYRVLVSLSSCIRRLTFAKFILLPAAIRYRFNINDQGIRVRFKKGVVYEQSAENASVPQGTRMLCTLGGDKPLMSYVDGKGMAQLGNFIGRERVTLREAAPISDSLPEISVSFTTLNNDYPGCRLIYRGSIQMGQHLLRIERSRKGIEPTTANISADALTGISDCLNQLLAAHGTQHSSSKIELVEAFLHFWHFERGLHHFATALPRLLDFLSKSRDFEAQQAVSPSPTATPKRNRFGSGGVARKMMQAQYRW